MTDKNPPITDLARIRKALAWADIVSINEALILCALDSAKEPLSLKSLREKTSIPYPTLSRTLDGLAHADFVLREVSEIDRRKVLVDINERGLNAIVLFKKALDQSGISYGALKKKVGPARINTPEGCTLNRIDIEVLELLGSFEEASGYSSFIAQELGIARTTVSSSIARLKSKGLVAEIQNNASDLRIHNIAITDAGRTVLRTCRRGSYHTIRLDWHQGTS